MSTTTSSTRIYIANLGKYNEGELVGAWLELPATEEEIEALYVSIGVGRFEDGEYIPGVEAGGVVYEEVAIHDYETDIGGLRIGEYDSISELNELVVQVEALAPWEIEKLSAAMEYFGYQAADIIDRLDDFTLLSDIHDEHDLGYYWVEESGCYDTSKLGNLANYIDYDAFGRDINMEACGGFTDYGFIEELR